MTQFQFQVNVTQKGSLTRTVTGQSWWVENDVDKVLTGLWFMESQLFGQIDLPIPNGKVHFRVYRDPDFAANDPGVDYWGEFTRADPNGFNWEGFYGRALVAPSQSGGGPTDEHVELVLGTWHAAAVVISPIFASRKRHDPGQLKTLRKKLLRKASSAA